MSTESEAALDAAVQAYQAGKAEAGLSGQDPAAVSAAGLLEAAGAHLEVSRPLADLLAEYGAMDEANHAGEPFDAAVYAALGSELSKVRQASQISQGNLPGSSHAASAGIGG